MSAISILSGPALIARARRQFRDERALLPMYNRDTDDGQARKAEREEQRVKLLGFERMRAYVLRLGLRP